MSGHMWCPLCDWDIEDDGRHELEDEVRIWCRTDGGYFIIAEWLDF